MIPPLSHRRLLSVPVSLALGFFFYVLVTSFSHFKTNLFTEIELQNSSYFVTQNVSYPFFPLVYIGNGVDHMNINLVNLTQTGLNIGDEIGVFDGIYCVGARVIIEKDMQENSLSIPSSANDTIASSPNGFIVGHKITLKAYRAGTVYLLYFQTVNNSMDVFRKNESMFALVDFSLSTGKDPTSIEENVRIYPNPFGSLVNIEINQPQAQMLTCEIVDVNGNLIRRLYRGEIHEKLELIWDGRDSNQQEVPSGIYFCRLNNHASVILFKRNNY